MKNKPDPAQFISYLYGELQGEEKRQFEARLAASPELAEELREAGQLLGGLQSLPDVEAPPPPVFLAPPVAAPPAATRPAPERSPFSRLAQAVLAVAAGLSLLLVAGALTGTYITLNGSGLAVRFGAQGPPAPETAEMRALVAGLKDDIRALKGQNAEGQAVRLRQELAGLRQTLTELKVRVEAQGSRSPVRVAAGKSRRQVSEAQLNQLLASLSEENLRLIEEAFQAASEQQQRQLQESLAGFARYLDKIRAEDTELVLASIEELDRKSESKFRETDQAIDALLESVQTQEPE
jgi:anti-sigma factor RsiW